MTTLNHESVVVGLWLIFGPCAAIIFISLGFLAWREANSVRRNLWVYEKRESRWDDVRRKK